MAREISINEYDDESQKSGRSKGGLEEETGEIISETSDEGSIEGAGGALIVRESGRVVRRHELSQSLIVGSQSNSNIVLEDPTLSGQHIKIEFKDGKYILTDLGTESGTYVNDQRVKSIELRDGDVISVGSKFSISFAAPKTAEEARGEVPTVVEGERVASLIVMEGGKEIGRYDVAGELSIGRREDNDVVLRDPKVSRRHAKISAEGGKYILRDLNSSNGTLFEGEKIQEVELRSGAEFKIGGFTLKFVAEEEPTDETMIGGGRASGGETMLVIPLEATLTILEGNDRGKVFKLGDREVIGRGEEATIRINDMKASRAHAEIKVEKSRYYIADLGSLNGTFVGKKLVEKKPVPLKGGEKITVGVTVLKFDQPVARQARKGER